jgi:ribosomal protein S18 acetylase RimI-like enzyme
MKEKKPLKTIKIRKLRVKDLPQIIRIEEAITKAKVSQQKKACLKDHIQKEGSVSLVALLEGQVVGFLISEILTNSFGLDQSGWIENFGILPPHMGQGIGRALAGHLFEVYRKKKIFEIYTSVRWDSVDLLSFFKSTGFDRSNFINLYKKLDEDLIIK